MKATLAGMEWDVCGRTHGRPDEPTATIDLAEHRVSFNYRAYQAAGGPDALVPIYSAKMKSIGFRVADTRDALAVMVVMRKKDPRGGFRVSAAMLVRRMRADGYSGSLSIPLTWHPDGLLWGDLTMATKRQRKSTAGKGGKE